MTRLSVNLTESEQLGSYEYEAIPVWAPERPAPELLAPLRFYQAQLAAEDMVGHAQQRPLLPGQHFARAGGCGRCHAQQQASWQHSKHARAYATLAAAGRSADPECVVCHTVGFGSQGGYNGASRAQMANVGCESCHGPGGEHAANRSLKTPGKAREACANCHTPEHSPHYEPEAYLARIRHW